MEFNIFHPKLKNRVGIFFLFVADICILLGLFYLSVFIRKHLLPVFLLNLPVFEYAMSAYYWIFPIWLFIMVYEGAYSKRFTFWDEIKFLWKCTFFASLTIFAILFIGKQGHIFSRLLILTFSMFSFLLFPLIRMSIKRAIYSFGFMKRKVVILGAGESGRIAHGAIKNEPNLGYEIAGFIDDDPEHEEIEGVKIHRYENALDRYISRCGIHDIVIAKPELPRDKLLKIMNLVQHKVDNTLYIPDISGIATLSAELRHFFNEQTIVIEIKNNLARPLNYFAKRSFDYGLGFVLALISLIPIAVLSVIIRLTSKGPAVFRQQRVGKNNRPFLCYKFRTMYLDAEERLKEILDTDPEARSEWEKYWKLKNDPRVTKFGKFLRVTSLDELPQIFNVLKGEMSLVGPRPYLPRERDFFEDYGDIILSVPPGITGLWQTYGRSEKTNRERLLLDSWYVRNWNLWLDIIILIKTIYVVFKREGAH